MLTKWLGSKTRGLICWFVQPCNYLWLLDLRSESKQQWRQDKVARPTANNLLMEKPMFTQLNQILSLVVLDEMGTSHDELSLAQRVHFVYLSGCEHCQRWSRSTSIDLKQIRIHLFLINLFGWRWWSLTDGGDHIKRKAGVGGWFVCLVRYRSPMTQKFGEGYTYVDGNRCFDDQLSTLPRVVEASLSWARTKK